MCPCLMKVCGPYLGAVCCVGGVSWAVPSPPHSCRPGHPQYLATTTHISARLTLDTITPHSGFIYLSNYIIPHYFSASTEKKSYY